MAIDRNEKEIVKGKPFAIRTDWGCTIKFVKREGDFLILSPRNIREYESEVLDLRGLTYDPIVGRVIWTGKHYDRSMPEGTSSSNRFDHFKVPLD